MELRSTHRISSQLIVVMNHHSLMRVLIVEKRRSFYVLLVMVPLQEIKQFKKDKGSFNPYVHSGDASDAKRRRRRFFDN